LRRVLLIVGAVAVVLYVLRYLVLSFVNIDANLLWFRAIQHESVYTRTFWTEVVLFAIFGGLMAVVLAANLIAFHRHRPDFQPDPAKQRWRYTFKRIEPRVRWWLFAGIVLYFGVTTGARAAGNWSTWLQWRNAVAFGQQDPQFHRDISYFLFVYPMHRFVLTLLFRIVATAIILVLVAAYAYGGVRIRGTGPRMTRAVRGQLSLLLGIYLLLKAFGYWLDRFGLATSSRGIVTGPSYTDVHAAIPGKTVLVVIALVCAGVLGYNVVRRSYRWMIFPLLAMAFGALIFGIVWPAVVQQFKVKPSASSLEIPYIARNIASTRTAFGLSNDVHVTRYPGTQTLSGKQLAAQAERNAQVRILDPNRLSPTFNVKQQVQGFYQFKSVLDIDRYLIDGVNQDVAIAVRELNLGGLPSGRQTWTNTHLVYTHGFGVAAAPTNDIPQPQGTPNFIEGDLPPKGALNITQPRVYYGQFSPSYSIVGAPPGSRPKEFDWPSSNGIRQHLTTHTGGGGVPIGNFLNRLVYAIKLRSFGVLLSSDINKDSQLLTIRNPRTRVATVAPWLTLDGATYATVVDGHIEWVLDGYTTSNNYPYSQQVNLRGATTNTLTQSKAVVTQPNTSVNYMRNSVKAVVDAYSGKVTLYEWNQASNPDPVLKTWEHAFPGLVQPQSSIPATLLPHLRYPQDLFNVQRSLLTRYHVLNSSEFYNGSDFWTIPNDPTLAATVRLNSTTGTVSRTAAPTIPSTYMTMSPTGESAPTFSLTTPMVTLNKRNLAAVLTVNSQPGPGFGQFALLALPPSQSVESPSQIQNDIESTPYISRRLLGERGGNSRVVLGGLLTIPLGGQMLYVEPAYTQAAGANSFPILRHVIAIYGTGRPAFTPTLQSSLDLALGVRVTPPATPTGISP
jgi:uncharacterized membrane protein (UPF0182 family)